MDLRPAAVSTARGSTDFALDAATRFGDRVLDHRPPYHRRRSNRWRGRRRRTGRRQCKRLTIRLRTRPFAEVPPIRPHLNHYWPAPGIRPLHERLFAWRSLPGLVLQALGAPHEGSLDARKRRLRLHLLDIIRWR
jgi:hypothetical protein